MSTQSNRGKTAYREFQILLLRYKHRGDVSLAQVARKASDLMRARNPWFKQWLERQRAHPDEVSIRNSFYASAQIYAMQHVESTAGKRTGRTDEFGLWRERDPNTPQ